jgi:heme/copper-type cytochrome/quinol oxidase subunit 1
LPRFARNRFVPKYVFSLDDNVIGPQYALTSLVFLLIGFSLALLFRWQLAYPGQPVPVVGGWFGDLNAPGGRMLPEFYNQLAAMHGWRDPRTRSASVSAILHRKMMCGRRTS